MIEHALDVTVQQHDDGSQPRMHDLDILYSDRATGAVEVTAAADATTIEFWNIVNGGGRWVVEDIQGGWNLTVNPAARARRLQRELPDLLRQLEALEVREIRPRRHPDHPLDILARDLGVRHAAQHGTSFPGSIYITVDLPAERTGGFVGDNGDALALWIGPFLHHRDVQDVRSKLADSGAEERHAFLFFPGFTSAPFSVSDLLMRDGAPLPTVPPSLPDEVTHLWAVSGWATGDGFRWSPDEGWAKFAKLQAENHSAPGRRRA